LNFLGFFLVSVIATLGMAIVLVEKRYEWPVRRINLGLRWLLRKIHTKMALMPQCVVCAAFWLALPADLFLLIISRGHYWTWPLSGFAAAGFGWFILTVLQIMEQKDQLTPEQDAIARELAANGTVSLPRDHVDPTTGLLDLPDPEEVLTPLGDQHKSFADANKIDQEEALQQMRDRHKRFADANKISGFGKEDDAHTYYGNSK
jgi:hypothetical protein